MSQAFSWRNLAWWNNTGVATIDGGFVCNSTSSPTLFVGPDTGVGTVKPNVVASITYSTTGTWLVLFSEPFYHCVGVSLTLQMGTPDGTTLTFGGFTNMNSTTPPTATIYSLKADALSDLAAGTGNSNRIFFTFRMKRTSAR